MKKRLIPLVLLSFSLTGIASAEGKEFTYGDRAEQCLGGAAITSVVLAPATAVVYITEKPAAARNVAGLIAAGGCGLAMAGASIDPANASELPSEQDLKLEDPGSDETGN